jgi:hypothetical protein
VFQGRDNALLPEEAQPLQRGLIDVYLDDIILGAHTRFDLIKEAVRIQVGVAPEVSRNGMRVPRAWCAVVLRLAHCCTEMF